MLALTDTFHLVSSALTFSIANLSATYSSHAWYYIVPFSLPIAQVSILVQYLLTFQDLFADHDDCQRIPHDLPHSGEIHLRGEALLPPKEQVLPVLSDPGGPRPRVFSPVLPPQLLHAHHRPRDRPRPRDHRCQWDWAPGGQLRKNSVRCYRIFINQRTLTGAPWPRKRAWQTSPPVRAWSRLLSRIEYHLRYHLHINRYILHFYIFFYILQVVGYSTVPRLEFAEFRNNETYITVYILSLVHVRLVPVPCWI